MNRQPFTVAVMAKDEEWFIANTLESVIGVADEVLVGDMESEDSTAAIATELGATVMTVPTKLMVEEGWAAARNMMNRNAKYDWILTLDADEILSDAGVEILQRSEWPWSTSALITPTHTYKCSPGMSVEEARKAEVNVFPHRRMFYRHKVKWLGFVHEEPHFHSGKHVAAFAASTGIVREHFTGARPQYKYNWKQGCDAQLLMRGHAGSLATTGINSWWMQTYVPQNLAAVRAKAIKFFADYPKYAYLRDQI